jgi:HSP20 family protein
MNNLRLIDPGFGDAFENAMRRFFAPLGVESEPASLKMRLDVTEGDQSYEVKADIPGVKKEDISVRVEGNLVQIDAQMKSEKESPGDGDKVLRSERCFGSVSRSFTLGSDIDEQKVDAKYADGVLTLLLPKKASVDARRIQIN